MNLKTLLSFAMGPMIAGALGLITIPILTWYFPQEDIGRITLFQIVISLSVMVFSLSLHESYVREYNEVDNKADLLKISIIPGLLLLILSILFLYLFGIFYPKTSVSLLIFDINSSVLTFIVLLAIIFSFFINIFNHVIRMEERGIAFSIMQITPKLSFLIFAMIMIGIGTKRDFLVIAISFSMSLFTSFLVVVFLTKNSIGGLLSRKLDKQLMNKSLTFSLPLVFGGIAYWGLFAVDRIFLKIYSGLASVAIYTIATTLASSITLLSGIFTTLWHPIVYKWAKEGIEPRKIQEVINYVSLTVFCLWSLMGAVAWVTPYFFPKAYYEVEYLVVACASGPLLYLLSEVTVFGIGLSRKSVYSLCASFVALICCIVLNFSLIPLFGIKGAAISTTLTFTILLVLKTEFSNKLYGNLIKTSRIYFLTFLYVLYTLFYVSIQPESYLYICLWILLMIIVLTSYKDEISNIIKIVRRKL